MRAGSDDPERMPGLLEFPHAFESILDCYERMVPAVDLTADLGVLIVRQNSLAHYNFPLKIRGRNLYSEEFAGHLGFQRVSSYDYIIEV